MDGVGGCCPRWEEETLSGVRASLCHLKLSSRFIGDTPIPDSTSSDPHIVSMSSARGAASETENWSFFLLRFPPLALFVLFSSRLAFFVRDDFV